MSFEHQTLKTWQAGTVRRRRYALGRSGFERNTACDCLPLRLWGESRGALGVSLSISWRAREARERIEG